MIIVLSVRKRHSADLPWLGGDASAKEQLNKDNRGYPDLVVYNRWYEIKECNNNDKSSATDPDEQNLQVPMKGFLIHSVSLG